LVEYVEVIAGAQHSQEAEPRLMKRAHKWVSVQLSGYVSSCSDEKNLEAATWQLLIYCTL
jgi:hypothetical protein